METLSETALHPSDARSYGIVQRRHFGGLVNLVINLAAVLRRFIKADYLDFRRIEADEVTRCSCSGNFFCAFFYLKSR